MARQPLLYGIGLNAVHLSPYSENRVKSFGLGTPCRAPNFYVRATESPLKEPNTILNVLDNEKGIDNQSNKTDFCNTKENLVAEEVPGNVPEDKTDLFQPIANSEAELKHLVACKRKAEEEAGVEHGPHGDDLRTTKKPCVVTENVAETPAVNPELPKGLKKRKKVYKAPQHRLRVLD